jgi:hypothetical protein
MPTFMVECYWPGITEEHVKQALTLLSEAERRPSAGEAVTSLGCILVLSDGMAIFLFEAAATNRPDRSW